MRTNGRLWCTELSRLFQRLDFDHSRLRCFPARSKLATRLDVISDSQQLQQVVFKKSKMVRQYDFLLAVIVQRGCWQGSYGLVVIGNEIMPMIEEDVEREQRKTDEMS